MPHKICDFVPVTNRNPHYAQHEIGDWTYGLPTVVCYGEGIKLKIGKFCSIADGAVFLLGGEHRPDMVTTYPLNAFFPFADNQMSHRKFKGDIIVGNDVWIGRNALILSGVTIGNGAVIGAGTVIAKDVAPYSVVVGNPAKRIRLRFDEAIIEDLNRIAWWDWPMEKIQESLPLLLSEDIEGFVAKYKGTD